MTWRRLLNRNQLQDGDYRQVPAGWHGYCQEIVYGGDAFTARERQLFGDANAARQRLREVIELLAGDLRRLERDAQDEQATARHIAARTGVDPDVVAAVLKEFMSW